jgi:hypothetical protein
MPRLISAISRGLTVLLLSAMRPTLRHNEQGKVSTFLNGEVLDEHIQLKRLIPVMFAKRNPTTPQAVIARQIALSRHFGVVYDVTLNSFHAVRSDSLKKIQHQWFFQESQIVAGTLNVLESDTSFADIHELAYSDDGCLTERRNPLLEEKAFVLPLLFQFF